MGPVTDVPLLERGSPETNRGPAVATPRIRVCSTGVSAAAPCHARSSGGHLASERIGDEHPCLQLLNRDMRAYYPALIRKRGLPPPAVPLAGPGPDRAGLVRARGPAADRGGTEPGRARGLPRSGPRRHHRRGRPRLVPPRRLPRPQLT